MGLLCSQALFSKVTINFQQRGLDLEKSWREEKEKRWDAQSEQQGKTKRWRKEKEKEEMKGGGSAIQHQSRSTSRMPGDSWRVVTSQAVGLDHIRESTDTKAKSSLCPWHCCPECHKVPSAPSLLVLHSGPCAR